MGDERLKGKVEEGWEGKECGLQDSPVRTGGCKSNCVHCWSVVVVEWFRMTHRG